MLSNMGSGCSILLISSEGKLKRVNGTCISGGKIIISYDYN